MASERKKSQENRPDGRRSLLVYMDAALIKDLKKAALDEDCNAYDIVEAATREWLERYKKNSRQGAK